MVHTARLPAHVAITHSFCEHRFPILYPAIESCGTISRPGKEMQVVRHQDVRTNFPMRGGAPDFDERCMDVRIGQPRPTTRCAGSKKDQSRRSIVFNDSFGRVSSLGQHYSNSNTYLICCYSSKQVRQYRGTNTSRARLGRRIGATGQRRGSIQHPANTFSYYGSLAPPKRNRGEPRPTKDVSPRRETDGSPAPQQNFLEERLKLGNGWRSVSLNRS
jgi:hypothetical protein